MANDNNKWSKPSNPPPPLFLGEKERDLVKQVNDELLERVIGQQILYLPISMDRTNFHPLYGEAIEKSFLPPIGVHAMVEFEGIATSTDHYGLDKTIPINVKFHERRLHEDQDLYVREGDYVQYGDSFFEIVSLTEGRQLFGQVDHLFQIEAKCIKTRKGLIDINVLPPLTQAALHASQSSTEDSGSSGSGSPGSTTSPVEITGDIVRIVYSFVASGDISPGTDLTSIFGIVDALDLAPTAVYDSGLRMSLTDSPTTGEYYIDSGNIYNTFEIFSGSRITLEVLTVV